MITTLIIVLSFFGYYLLKRAGQIVPAPISFLNQTKVLRIALIVTIGLRYLMNLDYNDSYSCFAYQRSIFEKYDIYLSAVSLSMITIAAFIKNNRLKLALHVSETIYWIVKLILFKRNYADGILGMPNDIHLLFDFISLALRMIIIRNLAFTLRTTYVLMISFVFLIGVKWLIFPNALGEKWEKQIFRKATQEAWHKLQGKWIGKRFYSSADTINPKHSIDSAIVPLLDAIDSKGKFVKTTPVIKIEHVSISVDSNVVKISSERTEARYILNLESNVYGELFEILPDTARGDTSLMNRLKTKYKIHDDGVNNARMYLEKLEFDSLVFTTGHDPIKYLVSRVLTFRR